MRDQPMSNWYIQRIYNSLELKQVHSFKVIKAVKANTLAPTSINVPPKNISCLSLRSP
jgi:hypothetical protein